MAHVATRVPSFKPPYIVPVTGDHPIGERGGEAPVRRAPAFIPPDLEAAYGVMSGIVLGLLVWVGLLLPALYILL